MYRYLKQKYTFLMTGLMGCIFSFSNEEMLLVFIKIFIGLSTSALIWKILSSSKAILKNFETKDRLNSYSQNIKEIMMFLILFQLIPSVLFAMLYQSKF